jgi:ubiquinone/menaquinone biosynthesis C-methylase UbiE
MLENDPASYMEKLYLSNPVQEPLVSQVVQAIELPTGSCGLDAGCGVGLQVPPLAEAVGAGGHITGLDISGEFLAEAEKNVANWGLARRVTLVQGDIYDLPFEDQRFDWIWSASCACYSMSRPLQLLQGFRRILKPGGLLVILIWSSQQLLPGYPRLEALLNATAPGIAPFKKHKAPAYHFLRLLGWLKKAGFGDASVQPFSGGVYAPLDEKMRDALLALVQMRWPGAEKELNREDRLLYHRITDPSSPEFILDQPDYYAFYTYSLFRARGAQ